MKNQRKTILSLLGVIVVLGLMIPAGLFATFLFAQQPPPQLGLGALHKVEVITISKCEASITAFTASNKPNTVNISVPDEICQALTGANIAVQATQILQEDLDFCQRLTDLPNEDPDKRTNPIISNPRAKSLKWRIRPEATYLCSSPVTINITWDGTEYNLSWRSTN